MRSELEKVAGISNIKTDVASQTCTFHLADASLDINAKLDELASGNDHLKKWTRVESVN